ncbi:MAG TPA: RHS repeat-associated core domain-containing protein [Candidatus Acidoferrales bacterium]|nr:RHS repeat-associated core domain-containing protein [Candidatus Acidoferrales bacterium]
MRNVTSGNIYYYEEDMLGSSRTMVQAGQTSVCYDADFYPFGGERDITNTCTQHYKFEGKERDTETGNDDFGARYYTSRLGRWLSADWSAVPAPVPYANLTNPQTLNLYAMVSDNPETFADLDGHLSGTEGLCWVDFCAGSTQTEAAREGDGPPAPSNTGDGQQLSNSQQAAGANANVQSDEQHATQQKTNTDDTPSKFVIEPDKTENHGSYSDFHYQLENSEGQPLTGNGYSLQEHTSGAPSSMTTSDKKFIPLNHGDATDRARVRQLRSKQ